jgi:Ni,Fe-hydrogenase III small subunit
MGGQLTPPRTRMFHLAALTERAFPVHVPAFSGLACCATKVLQTGGLRHDLARFGREKTGATPRQADLMIVAGRVSQRRARTRDSRNWLPLPEQTGQNILISLFGD